MLIVLIFDNVIKGQKLKIGGKLSRMVKENHKELEAILGTEKEETERQLPKYAYLRLNKLYKEEDLSSDDSSDDSDSSGSSSSSADSVEKDKLLDPIDRVKK